MTSAYEEEWRDKAACLTSDPELWFPKVDHQASRAREICGACPVREQCLALAIANDERDGIWAGMNRTERNAARRQLAKRSKFV